MFMCLFVGHFIFLPLTESVVQNVSYADDHIFTYVEILVNVNIPVCIPFEAQYDCNALKIVMSVELLFNG